MSDARAHEPGRARFAALYLERIALLVPLGEVQSLEPVADVDTARGTRDSTGALALAHSWLPVFSLTDDLQPFPELPETHRMCAVLAAEQEVFALSCRTAVTIDSAALVRHPLPDIMQSGHSPVHGLASRGGEVFALTTAAALVRILATAHE